MLIKPEIKDDDLVKGLSEGDEICFDRLFLKYSKAIFKICRIYKFEQPDAEEVVQEVFIKIWENRSKLNPDFSFKAYLLHYR